MSVIEDLYATGKISRINERELPRYVHFFEESYIDNLEHSRYVLEKHPRWSIISGYYAMHDITKLLLAKQYSIKINQHEVHATTILVLSEILKEADTIDLLKDGYDEYRNFAQTLSMAKKERGKAQYYTGTSYMFSYYREKSGKFLDNTVDPYILRMKTLSSD